MMRDGHRVPGEPGCALASPIATSSPEEHTMDGGHSTGEPANRPRSPHRAIDAACDRFEATWRAGPRPRIEDFLAEVSQDQRPTLLRELIAVEIELRRAAGE